MKKNIFTTKSNNNNASKQRNMSIVSIFISITVIGYGLIILTARPLAGTTIAERYLSNFASSPVSEVVLTEIAKNPTFDSFGSNSGEIDINKIIIDNFPQEDCSGWVEQEQKTSVVLTTEKDELSIAEASEVSIADLDKDYTSEECKIEASGNWKEFNITTSFNSSPEKTITYMVTLNGEYLTK
jgi:hypothetical protein